MALVSIMILLYHKMAFLMATYEIVYEIVNTCKYTYLQMSELELS